jgi:AcrR family transcriptional regulator
MARELNVTTGSFYWHFNTVNEFRDELKAFWRDKVVVGIIVDAK